jgi:hypothetical protein
MIVIKYSNYKLTIGKYKVMSFKNQENIIHSQENQNVIE